VPVTQGIIDTANVPRLTSLVRSITVPSTLSNPYAGVGYLPAVDAGVPAYGLKWSLESAPANAGRSSRAVVEYEIKYLSLAVLYSLADASLFVGDSVLTGLNEGWILFETGQPDRIGYDVSDGFTVNFAWLIAP
jgi:hypothetical protein